ncbi:hybrid sensor histidine kinase/response regulator [Myxosarcina sp. GI1]|uniref:hybrid sensor histidine kinase/response regulator n=1 Tax=Myxosarcina sp. GI1 TaxID=1541065 RepID=UPI00055B6C17|nr:hybrid sensor histidine kinase/response regulator [Myxosarcina sp. GI1]
MDTELQIRLNFLDEAEEYFDRIETNLLGLTNSLIDPQQVDLMLRAAHSVKGGAGMMQFPILSRVAHRLEDFFKILRVRYGGSSISIEVENLLLQGVDCLRQVSDLLRQGVTLKDFWFDENAEPIFARLRQHLGELETADEDALMAQDEDVDPALLMFEEGVDAILERFETRFGEFNLAELASELATTAKELVAFGQMANLQPFVELCQSIEQQAQSISSTQIESLAEQALTTWKRSHALVMRGRVEVLPTQLEGEIPPADLVEESDVFSALDEFETLDFAAVSSELANFNGDESTTDFDLLTDDALELENMSALQAEFDVDVPEQSPVESEPQKQPETEIAKPLTVEMNSATESNDLAATSQPQPVAPAVGKMVRVPLEQLRQFNNLFEKLVLERNTINLRLKQLQTMTVLMNKRMQQIEQSNTQLKQWYDRASIEGVLSSRESLPASAMVSGDRSTTLATGKEEFDVLEMDRYSDLHLICQEQIETIVQLQEVTTDIDFGLQELTQAARNLDRTTRSLQSNVTRTQMLPFAEVVKRFPRLVRDLNFQFGKQVNLTILGENTLIDRSVLETLSDPLMHLLRNAFDHGIEDSQTRIAAGKPAEGSITLQAVARGTETVITLSDDGGGISVAKIGDRLRSLGISQDHIDQLSQEQILDFIFEPGFSTAKQVTELSGRGVGMDVVRNNLKEIQGNIRVQTQPGLGSTFTLRIPFTLSILRVAIVEQSGIIFALPVNSVREIMQLRSGQLKATEEGKEQLLWQEQNIDLVRLENSLTFRRPSKNFRLLDNPIIEHPMALIVGDETKFVALHIDRFWGERDATTRPIESPVPLPSGFVSSMILGDGRVIPVVDPVVLAEESLNRASQETEVDNNLAERDLPPASQIENQTILIIDDSVNVRRYLALTLEKAGYEVEQAKDGREAVDKLLGGLKVRAAICDIEMPRLDGYGVLEEIKGRKEFQDLPIAMLTSRSNDKHRKLAMNLGASAYFSKPYNERELLQKLAELIKA